MNNIQYFSLKSNRYVKETIEIHEVVYLGWQAFSKRNVKILAVVKLMHFISHVNCFSPQMNDHGFNAMSQWGENMRFRPVILMYSYFLIFLFKLNKISHTRKVNALPFRL